MESTLYAILLPALLPVFVIFRYIYKKDKIEKEPLGFVLKVLFFGAIFSIPCAGIEILMENILQFFLEENTISYAFIENTIGVALIEELSKLLVLMIFVWKNDNFDYRYDGIVYATASSLGFAALENILYIISYGTEVSIARAIFSIPGHTTFGIFMGFYISRAKKAWLSGKNFKKKVLLFKSLFFSTLIHGLYDFQLSDQILESDYSWLFYVFVILLDIISLKIIKHEFKTDQPLGVIHTEKIDSIKTFSQVNEAENFEE